MKMGGGPKQFGVDAEQVPELLGEIGRAGLAFRRLPSFRRFAESAGRIDLRGPAEIVRTCAPSGGGCAIASSLPESGWRLRDSLLPRRNAARTRANRRATWTPSFSAPRPTCQMRTSSSNSAATWSARLEFTSPGSSTARVSRGQTFLVVDGGLNHHLSASGNFGQVIRKNYPVAIGNRMASGERETATVVGPLCTPLDLLADRMELAIAFPGDLVVIFQSGAYGASASPHGFLGHPAPIEVLV